MRTIKHLNLSITLTSDCNCNCPYCFEKVHPQNFDTSKTEPKTLFLIEKLLRNFNSTGYESVTIDFWGGEPFMNFEYMKKILDVTSKYDFVDYKIYTNGTMIDTMLKLNDLPYNNLLKRKTLFSISYDGKGLNELQRAYSGEKIVENARKLHSLGFNVHFKSTISFDNLKLLEQQWESIRDEVDKNGYDIRYSPSFDSTQENIEEYTDIWIDQIKKIMKKEYKFFKTHKRFLLNWLANPRKSNFCDLNGRLIIHNDGKLYPCLGFAQLKDEKRKSFSYGNIENVNDLIEIFDIRQKCSRFDNPKCINCETSFCTSCRSINTPSIPPEKWSMCIDVDTNKCTFFKIFSNFMRVLFLTILKNHRNVFFNYKTKQYEKFEDITINNIFESLTALKADINNYGQY